jgi:hypothetical protein
MEKTLEKTLRKLTEKRRTASEFQKMMIDHEIIRVEVAILIRDNIRFEKRRFPKLGDGWRWDGVVNGKRYCGMAPGTKSEILRALQHEAVEAVERS